METADLIWLLVVLLLTGIFFAGYWIGRDVESKNLTHLTDAEYDRWLAHGITHQWISDPFCQTHDGGPLRDWEEEEFDDGGDPCVLTVRLWKDGYEDVTDAYMYDVPGRPQ